MNKFWILPLLCLALLPCRGQQYNELYANLPFEMPEVIRPVFPEREVLITEFGGVGDGRTLNTEAFDQAMDNLAKRGGGVLRVPRGVWYTGPIVFRSNINLYLDEGALILFTTDYSAYPLVITVYEGQESRRCQSPISGDRLENIAITGKGAINGSGQVWRPLKKAKVTDAYWKSVIASGGCVKNGNTWWLDAKAFRLDSVLRTDGGHLTADDWEVMKVNLRPVMVNFSNCKNILLEGVLFENSPAWNIHPVMCENIIIDGVFIRNPAYAQNGDGLDLESCRNVIVVNTTLDVGDDAICLKSGKDQEGRSRGIPTENVIVNNCKVFKGHGGFVVGSEMSGGVRNVSVTNCTFLGTDVGLRFKSCRGRGGVVENIYIDGISMYDIVNESFLFDLYYGNKADAINSKTPLVTDETPAFRNIYVKNLVSRNAGRAMFFNGLPEMNIENINIEHAVISARTGAEITEADGVSLKEVTIIPANGAALILNNVKNFRACGFGCPQEPQKTVVIHGADVRNVWLPASLPEKRIVVGEQVKRKEIKW